MGEAAKATNDDKPNLKATLNHLREAVFGLFWEPYPDSCGVVLSTRKRLGTPKRWFLPALDDGDDNLSRTQRKDPVTLTDHTTHVCDQVNKFISQLPLGDYSNIVGLAAKLHDLGKADERFQAMLCHTDRTDAWLLAGVTSEFLAKSGGLPQTRSERSAARIRSGLPKGFRHEMLSVQLAEHYSQLPLDAIECDLVLHLIAAHHGRARPFAPVVIDDDPPEIEVAGIKLTPKDRLEYPPHRLDSGVAERFWALTRRFGWWGPAYLEAVLRLADQQASAAEDAGKYDNEPVETTT